MAYIRLESQMRAGTHYLLDALMRVCHGKVKMIKDNKFEFVSREEIAKGLYDGSKGSVDDKDSVIFHCHYYHELPQNKELAQAKHLYLIGYPFDSFFSDALVFSSEKYSVAPSVKNKRRNNYRLLYGSKEWDFLEPYMHKNASWLQWLAEQDNLLIIRYEEFFLNFKKTTHRIEKYLGPFKERFPSPRKNPDRIYWTGNFRTKMDKTAFIKLSKIFAKGLDYFYPEKKTIYVR